MNSRFTRYLSGVLLLVMITITNFVTTDSEIKMNSKDLLHSNACKDCIGKYPTNLDLVDLDTFPVNLDLLFWEDQLAEQAARLNWIGNGTWGWMLTPWGGHFISNHFEGADKWYFYADRPLNITTPIAGKVLQYKINNGTIVEVNGNSVVVDVRLVIDIGNKCAIKFEHLTILESLHEKVKDKRYTFEKNELLGYPTEWATNFWTIDFHYWHNYLDICPYPALSPHLKDKLTNLYSLQYERAKIAGIYPQSKLCNDMNITIKDTIWGVWEYKTGPYDSFMEAAERTFGLEVGGFTLLNRNFTNPETFHRDLNNPNKTLSTETVGLFRDAGGDDVPGYDSLGTSMVKLVEGNYQNGILELTTTAHWDWDFNTSVFMKFTLFTEGSEVEDEQITIEHFSTLIDAQNGFTENAIVFQRFLGFQSQQDNMILITLISVSSVFIVFIVILIALF